MQFLLLSNFSATIDIVALCLFTAYALYGLIRGFTKTFFSVFGTIIGLVLAILIAPSVVNFLQSKYSLLTATSNSLSGLVQGLLPKGLINAPLIEASQEKLSGVATIIANAVLSLKGNATVSPEATIGEAVASIFAYYVILVVCIICLFIIFKIIFFIIGEIVKKAYANKLVASVDRILGLALGIINGIFNLGIILLIISIIPIPFFQQITLSISDTVFTKFVQNINIYQLILNAIINNNIIGTIL